MLWPLSTLARELLERIGKHYQKSALENSSLEVLSFVSFERVYSQRCPIFANRNRYQNALYSLLETASLWSRRQSSDDDGRIKES